MNATAQSRREKQIDRSQGQRGSSLLETLVTVSIFAIIALVLGGMFLLLMRLFTYSRIRDDVESAASAALVRVTSNLLPAHNVEDARTVDGTLYTTDADTLVLKLAAIDGTGVPMVDVFDYIVITRDSVSPSRLMEIIDADPASSRNDLTRLLADGVADLSFRYDQLASSATTTVTAAITVRKTSGTTSITQSVSTYAKLRNK